MKKLFCILACVCVLTALCAIIASAETVTGSCGENATFSLDTDTGILTINGKGTMIAGSYWKYKNEINKVLVGSEITAIDSMAFLSFGSLTNVTVNSSTISIGESAFWKCNNLASIEFFGDVTDISYGAFYNCTALSKITINGNFKRIDSDAFEGCAGITNTIDGVKYYKINNNEYYILGLLKDNTVSSVNISEKTNFIIDNAFADYHGSQSLTCINVDSANAKYCDIDGVLFNKDKTEILCYPHGRKTVPYSIPVGVEKIGNYSFYNTMLESITIPNGVVSIGEKAFANSYIESGVITLPSTVTDINYHPFSADLRQILVEESNPCFTDIDGVLFNEDKTKIVFYPGSKELSTYTIPDTVVEIEEFAFAGAGLNEIFIPNGVTTIGRDAFHGCYNLKNIELPNSITYIDSYAFYDCASLTDVTLPDNIAQIETGLFWGCEKLSSVTIPNNVTSISSFAFADCYDLASIVIPAEVTYIDFDAFLSCDNLTIFCYKNSYAEEYAIENNIPYEYIDSEKEPVQGDLDGDGVVNIKDVLVSISALLNGTTLDGADMDGDGKFTLIDVIRILKAITT